MPCRLRHLAALASLVLSAAPVVRAQDAPAPAAPSSPADRARALGQGLASSFVQIDWVYQPDRGELPRSMSARYQSSFDRMVQPSIDQERPFPGDGYLLTPTLVVTADFMVADRFAREVRVRFGEHEVAATVAAVARRQTAVFLELEAPLPGTTPLTFSPDAPGPYWCVAYARAPWSWFTSVDRLPGSIWMNDLGEAVISVQADAVLVSESGGRSACPSPARSTSSAPGAATHGSGIRSRPTTWRSAWRRSRRRTPPVWCAPTWRSGARATTRAP